MQESNFENKVQQEMQEFRVKPSDEVWLKVEERIRKKKRRRIFFILFFAGLALVGYWQRDLLFNEKEVSVSRLEPVQQTISSDKESVKNNVSEKTNTDRIVKEDLGVKKNDLVKTEMLPAVKSEKNISVNAEKKKVKSSEIAATKTKKEKPVVEKKLPDINNQEKVIQAEDISIGPPVVENKNSEKKEVLPITDIVVSEKSSDSVFAEKLKDSIDDNKVQNDSIKKSEVVVDSTVPFKKKPAVTKKWKWGVQVTPGVSSFSNKSIHLFDFLNARMDNLSSTPSTPAPVANPVKRKSGFAIQISAFAQRKISPRLDISFGLQYGYYSDHIKVGSRRDSLLNNSYQSTLFNNVTAVYSAANPSTNYTNRYHFIELPVAIYYRLNKNSERAFTFKLGFVPGQKIGGNALIYNVAFQGIYYNNNSFFNKTQFALSPGLLWTIPGKKFHWSIGPELDIHINRFLNNPFESQKFLIKSGIKTQILFQGKN